MIRRIPTLVLASILALVLFCPAAWAAEEKILDFASTVRIRPDSSMEVTEVIKVVALGKSIKRGIIREFPTKYKGPLGGTIKVGFKIVKILRDGKTEDFHTKKKSNGVAVYIGRSSVYLKPGEYTYTIVYETDRQLGYFKDYDELYWNVTGNGWTFAIEKASARIILPPGGKVLNHAGYTGPQGAKGKDFTASNTTEGMIFKTTRRLEPREGLTVAVSWPKGLVAQPTFMEDALQTYRPVLVGVIGLALVFAYYLFFWVRVGRDPAKGTIIPLYEPPAGLSPAAVRFVTQMGFDRKSSSVALVDMAVKKYLTIREDDGEYSLHRTGEIAAGLSAGEKKMARQLFSGTDKIVLKKTNHRAIGRAVGGLTQALKAEYGKSYFMTNRGYFALGLALSLVVMAGMVLTSDDLETGGFISLWLTIWSFGVGFLVYLVYTTWRNAFSGKFRLAEAGGALFITFFTLPFFIGEIVGLVILSEVIMIQGILIGTLLAFLNILFFNLLKAPTKGGRTILDQIEGFKRYLTVAEKDRINLLNPPEETPELFEKYLPYAMALDVEVQWGERFAAVLAQAAQGDKGYSPVWYSGRAWGVDNISGFASNLGSTFSGAVSSSSTAPGSSSGSSGGGSSGGGGGGGGGSGW